MIDKNSHTPIYVQLESILLEMIESGDLKPGDLVPSENELSKKYSISRMTAKKAIDSLTIKGLVERSQGKGTYVSSVEKKIELPINRLRGFTQKVCEMGLTPENRVLAFEKIPCPKNICKILGVEEGANVWRMERVRQIDEVPAVFEESYISVKLLPDLKEENLLKSKFDYIKNLGLEIGNSEREISAEIPSDYVASALKLKRNEPILLAENITYLKKGEVLEYSKIYYNQKRYRFKFIAEIN